MPASKQRKKFGLGSAKKTVELELPSGETCLVVRPGIQGLIKAGILDSLDSLTGIVQVEHIDANDPKAMAAAIKAAAKEPNKLLEGLTIVDKIIAFVVQQPKVHVDPPDADTAGVPELPDGEYWASEVDLDDKMFIFQFVVGGTRDLESFRTQREAIVGHMANGEGVPVSPQ